MKKIITFLAFISMSSAVFAQKDSSGKKEKSWFEKNVKIGQSMETAEQKEEPAQFQITLPKVDSASWLVNVGVSVKLKTKSPNLISKLTLEYHRNTLTDKKQNNFQAAYTANAYLFTTHSVEWYLAADAKYVFDDIESKHSLASNLLFTFLNSKGPFNKFVFNDKNTQGIFVSLFAGAQLQEVLKAKNDSSKGFILRPLYTATVYYDILSKKQTNYPPLPTVRLTANYTGRVDAVNSTKYKENYSQLLSVGAEWFLAYKPVRVSIGGCFNYGSDPLKGLKQQQYWLLSLNLYKK